MMNKTRVVHCKKEPYDFYGGRPSFLGNPYKIGQKIPIMIAGQITYIHASRETTIDMFSKDFHRRVETDSTFRAKVLALKGHTLACWCKPKPCHLDVVAEWLDEHDE